MNKIIDGLKSAIRFARGEPAEARVTIAQVDIIAFFDPWTLACAAGAENGSIGVRIGYHRWLEMSEKKWLPEVQRKSGLSRGKIIAALTAFVGANSHRPYQDILKELNDMRGLPGSIVLGPGESISISVPLQPTR